MKERQVSYELWNGSQYIGKSPIKEQIMNASNGYEKPMAVKVYVNGEREIIFHYNW